MKLPDMKKCLTQLLLSVMFILCMTPSLNAQNNRHKLDSLLNVLHVSSTHDSLEALTLVRISKEYWSFQIDSAHFFCDESMLLSKKINYKTGLRFALKIKGLLYHSQSLYDSALVYLNLLKEQCPQSGGQSHICMIEFYNNAAGCYEGMGDFTMSLNYYLNVARIAEEHNDAKRSCLAYNNISGNYRVHRKDYNSAYTYALKAIELSKKTDEVELKGTAHERCASALADMGKFDSALYYAKKSLEYYEELTSCPDCMVGQYVVIADIFLKMNQDDSALVYSNKAVALGKGLTQQEYYADAFFKLGKSLAAKGQQQAAINALNNGRAIASELQERYDVKYLAYEAYIYVYGKANDYKSVSLYKDSLHSLEDSLSSAEVANNLNTLKIKYETDKKENEMQPKFVTKPAFTVVGLLIHTKGKSPEIPQLWDQFVPRIDEIKHRAEPYESYGLMDRFDRATGAMDYMAGNSVKTVGELPVGMSRWDVPANTYAVFETTLSKIGEAFDDALGTWLPTSGYRQVAAPYFERYGEDFSPNNPVLTIYLPVEKV